MPEAKDFDALKKRAPLNWLQILTLAIALVGITATTVWVAGEVYHKFLTHDMLLEYNLSPENGRVDRKFKALEIQVKTNTKEIEDLKIKHNDGTKFE